MRNKIIYLIKNIGLFTISNFATKLLSFLIVPFYTYYLSTEQYASIDLINTAISLLVPLLTVSVGDGILRYVILEKKQETKEVYFNCGCLITWLGFILLLISYPLLQYFQVFGEYTALGILIYLLTAFNTILSNYSRADNKIVPLVISSILNTALLLGLNIVLIAGINLGVIGYLSSMIVALLIANLYLMIVLRVTLIPSKKKFDTIILSKMLRYSLPLVPNSIFWWINNALSRFFLNFYSGLSMVGLFSVANKIPSILSVFVTIFQQAWNLSAFKEYENNSTEFFKKVYKYFNSFSILAASGLILITKILASLMFQKDFYQAWIYVPILIMAFYYSAISAYLGSFYTASEKTAGLFITTLIGAIISIICNFMFIPSLGAQGAALSICISNFVLVIIRLRFSRRVINISISLSSVLIPTTLMAIQSILLINNYTLYSSLCFMLLCFYLLLLFKQEIIKIVNKLHHFNK